MIDTPAPDWLDSLPFGWILVALLGVLLVVLLVWGTIRIVLKVHPIAQKVQNIYDDIMGEKEREGVEARPSLLVRTKKMETAVSAMDGRLESVEGTLQEIKAEVTPNHGSSAHDKLSREIAGAKEAIETVRAEVSVIHGLVVTLSTTVGTLAEVVHQNRTDINDLRENTQ